MRSEVLIHFELIKAQLRRFRVWSQHLYPDFFKPRTVLCKQFDLRVDQRCDRVDIFPAANVEDRIKIIGRVNTRDKIMRVCHIQGRGQSGQVCGDDPVVFVHGLPEVLQQLHAPSGAAK